MGAGSGQGGWCGGRNASWVGVGSKARVMWDSGSEAIAEGEMADHGIKLIRGKNRGAD